MPRSFSLLEGEPGVPDEAVIVPVEFIAVFFVLGLDTNVIVAKPERGILPDLMLNRHQDIDDLAFATALIDLEVVEARPQKELGRKRPPDT